MINALLFKCLLILENKAAGTRVNELGLLFLLFDRLLGEVSVKS
jgi:hypothetical protein